MSVEAGSAAVLTPPKKPTCKKAIGEDPENIGTTVAIMRIIDLIP